MLAKITSKNQLTLPKRITEEIGAAEYFDVEARNGQIVLTPVRIQRADAVRLKLSHLGLTERDVEEAVAWARRTPKRSQKTRHAEGEPTARKSASRKGTADSRKR
jgi:bifunctional DNA-binding transcriptional regulator/antitoxin component of YhaV-PrlF toxin-antitoxin module